MISAFQSFIKSGVKDWKLIVATSYLEKDKEEVRQLKESVQSQHISIVENIPQEKLIDLYKKAKIYWHAAGYKEDDQKHPERMEHFGMATVEAMSAGCIPVVINAGGQKEIVQDGENGYLWNNEDELLKKTRMLMNEKQTSLKTDNEELEKKFGIKRFCREITDIIQ